MITGGFGADTLTGGGEADAFVFAAANFTATSAAGLLGQADSITDFAKASDVLRFGSALGVTTVATAQIGGAAINSEGFATFAADDDTLGEKLVAVAASVAKVGDLGVFTHGSDTYVFIGGNAAAGVGSGDALIKLVGVTGLTDGTISTTDLTIT